MRLFTSDLQPLEGSQVVLTEDTLCAVPSAEGGFYRPNTVPALLTPFALARVAAPTGAHPQVALGELSRLFSATGSPACSAAIEEGEGEEEMDPDDEEALMVRVHVASLARDPLELVLRRLLRAFAKGNLLVLTDLRAGTELDPRLLKALHVSTRLQYSQMLNSIDLKQLSKCKVCITE